MIHLCTLYNVNYIDKGLVLYDSLVATEDEFCLYVLAIDDQTERILLNEHLEYLIVIPLRSLLEYESRLINVKKDRTASEFCWTCSSVVTEYVLEKYRVDVCTYIDADMFFYSRPSILLNELGASVGIIGHRFPKGKYYKLLENYSGVFCVEFNSFKNDAIGRSVLSDWKDSCLRCCNQVGDENGFGDQKYLNLWETTYKGNIYVYSNPGAGIATWNIKDYSVQETKLKYRGTEIVPVFYHFSSIDYSENNVVTIICDADNVDIVSFFYKPYLIKLEKKRDYLNQRYQVNLRKNVSIRNIEAVSLTRKAFIKEVKTLCKSFHFISALEKVINRKYVSLYSHNLLKVSFDLNKYE